MASPTNELYFLIVNCPGPFTVISGWMRLLEKPREPLVMDFTIMPVLYGAAFLGHEIEFRMPFEVALMGVTTKYGCPADGPRNVRLLGRFLIPSKLPSYIINPVSEAAPLLNSWRWEAVFSPMHRKENLGFVAKLETELSEDWTL